MILDVLDNANRYLALNSRFPEAFEFLRRPDLDKLPADRYEIDGQRVFAMVAKEPGRSKEQVQLETHEKYIDIQFVLTGIDTMGWKPKLFCTKPAGEYDRESDIQFFADSPEAWLSVRSGFFAIFFPEDAHMPMISPGQIHKVVVKIAADLK